MISTLGDDGLYAMSVRDICLLFLFKGNAAALFCIAMGMNKPISHNKVCVTKQFRSRCLTNIFLSRSSSLNLMESKTGRLRDVQRKARVIFALRIVMNEANCERAKETGPCEFLYMPQSIGV